MSQSEVLPRIDKNLTVLLVSFLMGLISFFSSPYFEQWYLAWAWPAVLFWYARFLSRAFPQATLWGLFCRAACPGVVMGLGGYYWVAQSLQVYYDVPMWLGLWVPLVGAPFLTLSFALFVFIYALLFRTHWVKSKAWLFSAPAAAVLYVALDGMVPRIFPENLAVTQLPILQLVQITDLVGPLPLVFVMVLVSVALWQWGERRLRQPLVPAVAVVLLGLVLGYGFWRMAAVDRATEAAWGRSEGRFRAAIVQPNVGHVKQVIRERPDGRRWVFSQLEKGTLSVLEQEPDLIVWPETAYPYSIYLDAGGRVKDVPAELIGLVQKIQRPILTGVHMRGTDFPQTKVAYNSAYLAEPGQAAVEPVFYHKGKLFIFGEYFPVLDWFVPSLRRYHQGEGPKVLQVTARSSGRRVLFAPLICHEAVYPGYVSALRKADVLINLVNDYWYGDTAEPRYHLALARMQAIAMHKPLIRATTTGISAVVDPVGRILLQTSIGKAAAVAADLALP